MKLATFKTAQGTSYGIVTGKGIVDLKRYIGNRFADLKALIGGNAFAEAAKHVSETPDYSESDVTWLPVIPNPDRILCVGLNYQDHVTETGRDNTEQPAIFIRLPESQVGHRQPIVRPRESTHLDFDPFHFPVPPHIILWRRHPPTSSWTRTWHRCSRASLAVARCASPPTRF